MKMTVKGYVYLVLESFANTRGTEQDAAMCCIVQAYKMSDQVKAQYGYVLVGEHEITVDVNLESLRAGNIELLEKKSEQLKAEHFKAQQEIADQIASLKCITYNNDNNEAQS